MAKRKKSKPKAGIETKTIQAIKDYKEDKLSIAVNKKIDKIKVGKKFKEWTALFLDKSNREYYGNATKCALKVYNTDNYATAGSIGSQNLKKLKNIGGIILENEGFGIGEMMKIGMAKVMSGNYGDWDKMMERLGYFEPPAKNPEGGNTFNFENLNVAIMKDRHNRGLE